MFELAASAKKRSSRANTLTLQARQAALSTAVSRLLVQNNEGEELAADKIAKIYDGVQRQLYLLLARLSSPSCSPVFTSFAPIAGFSLASNCSRATQRARAEINPYQESTLRHISRELHDEFARC